MGDYRRSGLNQRESKMNFCSQSKILPPPGGAYKLPSPGTRSASKLYERVRISLCLRHASPLTPSGLLGRSVCSHRRCWIRQYHYSWPDAWACDRRLGAGLGSHFGCRVVCRAICRSERSRSGELGARDDERAGADCYRQRQHGMDHAHRTHSGQKTLLPGLGLQWTTRGGWFVPHAARGRPVCESGV